MLVDWEGNQKPYGNNIPDTRSRNIYKKLREWNFLASDFDTKSCKFLHKLAWN